MKFSLTFILLGTRLFHTFMFFDGIQPFTTLLLLATITFCVQTAQYNSPGMTLWDESLAVRNVIIIRLFLILFTFWALDQALFCQLESTIIYIFFSSFPAYFRLFFCFYMHMRCHFKSPVEGNEKKKKITGLTFFW
ncbi:hypothetical protein MLD38_037681 [Melastoma candidum]|uniref:Uncharacterized protein n=1 Tax=Melastoma candidum TaxID=119954 RepID=A0ACB9LQ48_9MYRT|nr:hypothetical protein MLD38_037681 [Melastoma candidum]